MKFLRLLAARIDDSVPAALNAVPQAAYIAPRADSIGAFFALTQERHRAERRRTVATGASGSWSSRRCSPTNEGTPRPGAYENRNGVCDESEAFCYNAFPGPLDSLDNQPFDGTYDRTFPYDPPSRRSVLP